MSNELGKMAWLDLTVQDASTVKTFYQKVIGWKAEEVSMGDYSDFTMIENGSENPVGGICHAKGDNANIPPSWLPYFLIEDINQSVEQVIEAGGELVNPIRTMGKDQFAIIKDPAGAVCAIYQKGNN